MNTNIKIKNQAPKERSFAIAFTRITFGLVWAFDAYFKWQPAFANNFVSYIQETYDGQPVWIQTWLNAWIKLVSINPHLFARIVALGETGIAIGLLLGLFSNLAYAAGTLLSIVIWAVPEGFGARTRPARQMSEQGSSMFLVFWDYSC